jgi:hypothetical protein
MGYLEYDRDHENPNAQTPKRQNAKTPKRQKKTQSKEKPTEDPKKIHKARSSLR